MRIDRGERGHPRARPRGPRTDIGTELRPGYCHDRVFDMNKPLEAALSKVLRMSEEQQDLAAELLEQFAAQGAPLHPMTDDVRSIVRAAMERAKRGEFAAPDSVEAVLHRPWA